MELALVSLTFLATSLVAWELLRPKSSVLARRIAAGAALPLTGERRLDGGLGSRLLAPAAGRFGKSVLGLLPHNLVARVDTLLIQGKSRLTTGEFLLVWGGFVAAGSILLFSILVWSPLLGTGGVVALALAVAIGFYLGPYLFVRRAAKKRKKAITRSLPYALDLLVTCVESGLGVEAAVAVVTERTSGPLSEALSSYLRQVGLGRSRKDALTEVADRTGVQDLIRLAAAMNQAEEMGTTVGDVLRKQAEDMRLLKRQRVQEAAQRAPVMMAIPLTTCFLPALAAVILVPSFLSMFQFVNLMGGVR